MIPDQTTRLEIKPPNVPPHADILASRDGQNYDTKAKIGRITHYGALIATCLIILGGLISFIYVGGRNLGLTYSFFTVDRPFWLDYAKLVIAPIALIMKDTISK